MLKRLIVLGLAAGLVRWTGMAFTTGGVRLGRGKGFYDRALEHANPESPKAGVCFREQVVPGLPADPHDLPMHFLATPDGIASCR